MVHIEYCNTRFADLTVALGETLAHLVLTFRLYRELWLEHGEGGVKWVGAETAETGRDAGGEGLEKGGGEGGGDVEAGREALQAGWEAEGLGEGAGGKGGEAGRALHQVGQAGRLPRLGLGVQLHQPRDVGPLLLRGQHTVG